MENEVSVLPVGSICLPVRMFWNASSTLLASRADVSMKERLFSPATISTLAKQVPKILHTCKLLRLLRWYRPQMPQIALVSYQHDDNVGIGMISKLLQPPRDIVIGLVLADVVNQQRSHCSSVVCGCDGSVAFLTSGVPDLRLDGLRVDLDGAGCEFDTDGGLGV